MSFYRASTVLLLALCSAACVGPLQPLKPYAPLAKPLVDPLVGESCDATTVGPEGQRRAASNCVVVVGPNAQQVAEQKARQR